MALGGSMGCPFLFCLWLLNITREQSPAGAKARAHYERISGTSGTRALPNAARMELVARAELVPFPTLRGWN